MNRYHAIAANYDHEETVMLAVKSARRGHASTELLGALNALDGYLSRAPANDNAAVSGNVVQLFAPVQTSMEMMHDHLEHESAVFAAFGGWAADPFIAESIASGATVVAPWNQRLEAALETHCDDVVTVSNLTAKYWGTSDAGKSWSVILQKRTR